MLAPGGGAVFVIGDVTRSRNSVVSPSREFLRRRIYSQKFGYIECLKDVFEVTMKTARIWKETKGKATAVDRIIILSASQPRLRTEALSGDIFGNGRKSIPILDANRLFYQTLQKSSH